MANKRPKGAGRAEQTLRRSNARTGALRKVVPLFGPSVGSVVLDTRGDGRLGFVRNVVQDVVYLREPGSPDRVWDCPANLVDRPPKVATELAQLLDVGVTPNQDDPS
ncbi:hypothetical protein ACFV6D_01760 [Kitasatospora sp. NPDC059812]|uniref:hypothetical protein n=1 Tax=Kitasatospora sp. NPDC059812 TaxID=3346958 RepID=UPI00366A049E